MTTAALYYEGTSARPRSVVFTASDGALHIEGDGIERDVPLTDLHATSRLANVRRVLTLPDGAQVHCDDNDAVDALFPRRGTDRLIDRLERHAGAVATSIVVIGLSATLFFTIGLPMLAERIAEHVPRSIELALGDQVMATLDQAALEPSALPADEQRKIRDLFATLVGDAPDAEDFAIAFRKLQGGGANAFAVPGGTIIVTDGLVRSLSKSTELAAVIAHEIGHQRRHHVLRSILQSSVVVVIVAFLTGDVSSATGVVLGVPAFLLQNHYSREFENEADTYAFDILKQQNSSPEWFAMALTNLDASGSQTDAEPSFAAYLSTHPATTERIEAARSAAVGFPPLETVVTRMWAEKTDPDLHPQRGSAAAVRRPVTLGMLVGCWSGHRVEGEHESNWWASFADDGSMWLSFEDHEAGKLVSSHQVAGRWTTEGSVMTLRRLAVYDAEGELVRNVDSLDSYVVDAIDEATMSYRSLPSDIRFDSERVACEPEFSET